MGEKIIQVMPADGWLAQMECDDPQVEHIHFRLTCWALVEEYPLGQEPVRKLKGMSGDQWHQVQFVEDDDDFIEYIHEKDIKPNQ